MGVVNIQARTILSSNCVSQAIWHDSLVNHGVIVTSSVGKDEAHAKFK
jgi:hypothetical protein